MYNVRDSSMNIDSSSSMDSVSSPATIRQGIVREKFIGKDKKTHYVVEVNVAGTIVPVNCSVMVRFGGPYNFEEVSYRPYRISGINPPIDPLPYKAYDVRAGDVVVVGFFDNSTRAGVIFGCLQHPAHNQDIDSKKTGYINTYNSIETKITDDGEYRVTFKGKLLNPLDIHIPGTPILPPQYDPIQGGTYFSLSSDGSFTIDDNVMQSLKIDKTGKSTTITSGKTVLELTPTGYKVTTPQLSFDSKASAELKAASISMEAKTTVKVKGLKVAIGSSSFELIDGLIKLIDALGTIIVTSPVGPCNPLQGSPTWAQVLAIKTQLTAIKGSL